MCRDESMLHFSFLHYGTATDPFPRPTIFGAWQESPAPEIPPGG